MRPNIVVMNTQSSSIRDNDLCFKYFVEVPASGCVFASARESTGKAKLFLIFIGQGRIYQRNGISGTWQELRTSSEYNNIHRLFTEAFPTQGRIT